MQHDSLSDCILTLSIIGSVAACTISSSLDHKMDHSRMLSRSPPWHFLRSYRGHMFSQSLLIHSGPLLQLPPPATDALHISTPLSSRRQFFMRRLPEDAIPPNLPSRMVQSPNDVSPLTSTLPRRTHRVAARPRQLTLSPPFVLIPPS